MADMPIRAAPPRRPRGRPRAAEAETLESRLLDGALAEFVRTGYGSTSMSRIVQSLGVSKTTLYSRYPSKADLFRAIMSRQIARLAADTALRSAGTPLTLKDGLRAYGRRTLAASLDGDVLAVNRLVHSEAQRFPELGFASAERSAIGIRQVAAFIAERAVVEGVPCRDPEAVATAFIFMLRGWYVNAMLIDAPVSRQAIARFVDLAVKVTVSARPDW